MERRFVYEEVRISGGSYTRRFVYSKQTGILKHGSDKAIGGCIPNVLEEVRIQYTNSYTYV